MKIKSKESTDFQPVELTLTIESADELKELWCRPMDWNEIKAFADSKANRRELIDSTPNNDKLEHVDQPVDDIERCDKAKK